MTVCPVCGQQPVEIKTQRVKRKHPDRVEYEPGEIRFICPDGHHFDKDGNDRGMSMPEDYSVEPHYG